MLQHTCQSAQVAVAHIALGHTLPVLLKDLQMSRPCLKLKLLHLTRWEPTKMLYDAIQGLTMAFAQLGQAFLEPA